MSVSTTDTLVHRDETFRIRGAMFQVHSVMGPGFLEAVYQECLGIEFERRGITFEAMAPLKLSYEGKALRQTYVADFICHGAIIIELKAVRTLAPEHRAQLINYLRATGLKIGLLANFGAAPKMEIERFVV